MQNVNHVHQWKLRLPIVLDLVLPVKQSFSNPCQRQTQLQLPFQQFQEGKYFLAERHKMRDDRTRVPGLDQVDGMAKPRYLNLSLIHI